MLVDKMKRAAECIAIPGHPLYILHEENVKLQERIEEIRTLLQAEQFCAQNLHALQELAIHYDKKGDLLYPHLKVAYGVAGPSDLLWTSDDEIRADLAKIVKFSTENPDYKIAIDEIMKRMEDMIYKEEHVLFPNCAVYFSEEEWIQIYWDAKEYGNCFDVEETVWDLAENQKTEKSHMLTQEEVYMPGGHMTVEQIAALLNTIPMEITFIDGENINRFFNEGSKVFKRPAMAIDREVFSCHPPKVEPMVRKIIEDFRNGEKDSVPMWMEKKGKSVLVTYMAVRDLEKKYLGTVELVQDMEFAKEHFKQ